jgi:hypothetical protein
MCSSQSRFAQDNRKLGAAILDHVFLEIWGYRCRINPQNSAGFRRLCNGGVTQIKAWFNRFKDGRISADCEQRSGRLLTSRNADVIDKVRTSIMGERRLAVREVADEVGISRCSANTLLTEDLGMRRLAAKFVFKLLSPEQKQLS